MFLFRSWLKIAQGGLDRKYLLMSHLNHTLHFAFETSAVVDDVIIGMTNPSLPTRSIELISSTQCFARESQYQLCAHLRRNSVEIASAFDVLASCCLTAVVEVLCAARCAHEVNHLQQTTNRAYFGCDVTRLTLVERGRTQLMWPTSLQSSRSHQFNHTPLLQLFGLRLHYDLAQLTLSMSEL